MDARSDEDLLAASRAEPEAFAVLYRRHVAPLLAIAAPLDTWLPVGEYDPKAVRRASVPASYLVPTSDLRTKPHAG